MPLRLAALALALIPAFAAAQTAPAERAAVHYLQDNWARHGLAAADVAEIVVTDRVPGPGGMEVVYLRQAIGGVEVASGPLTVGVDQSGRVFHAAGRLTEGVAARKSGGAVGVSPEAAVGATAQASGVRAAAQASFQAVQQKGGADRETVLSRGGVARIAPTARLVYAEVASGALRLAWETMLFLDHGGDWTAHVDAATGEVLHLDDLLVREHGPHGHVSGAAPEARSYAPLMAQAASGATPLAPFATAALPRGGAVYRAFAMPLESPLFLTGAGDGRELISGVEDPIASPFGWHDTDGIAGPEFTITRGNNVHAYLDRDDDEEPDAGGEPDGGASLTFDFPLEFGFGPLSYTDASVVNLFYWSNVIHDVLTRYGFDEASGNFQANNYGNGGRSRDAVDAESQSGADVCNEINPCDTNANFSTPPDGNEPRMQMYIGSRPIPDIDGVFDHPVVVHEYGHGISNRLTGGPRNVACLSRSSFPEQMGEGWSDWYGLMFTMEPGDTRTDRRTVGNYLAGQPLSGRGFRPTPYSTDFAVNPSTYGTSNDIANISMPHGVGYVWATALWEVTWDLIDAFGFDPDLYNADGTAGNQIAMNLVTTGMKLQPCGPGFVDGRDAILAADEALYGGAHTDLLWAAFARRGLGFGADQGTSSSRSDQVEDFSVPESDPPAAVTDLAATPGGDAVTLAFTASGDDGTAGTAEAYLARAATAPILTEANWEAALPLAVSAAPQPSGARESVLAIGLEFETAYHIALRVVDDALNESPISNSVAVTTLGPPAQRVAATPVTFRATPEARLTTAELAISNGGASDLRYSLSLGPSADDLAAHAAAYASGADAREAAAAARAPFVPEAKGARRAARGPAVRGLAAKRGGGPDGFGYTWSATGEPGGPDYEWIDIASSGTELSLGDDDSETVSLPFAFPYYGDFKTEVTVSSNGYLTFNASQGRSVSNAPVPTPDAPNDAIFPYWDDLHPANPNSPARVLYDELADGRFVVSWLDVPHYPNDGAFSFQAVLSPGGRVLFQYQTLTFGGREGEATIGIENADGTDGLQVAFNESYAQDEMAISLNFFWGGAESLTGSVAPGTTETATLTADATGLAVGTYTGTLTVTTNDPDAAPVEVPLVLAVSDAAEPAAALSTGAAVVDVPQGTTATEAVTLTNVGGADLAWSLADASGALPAWLAVDAMGGTLAPGAAATITLTLDPEAAGLSMGAAASTTLALTTNDPAGDQTLGVTLNVAAPVSSEEGPLAFSGPYYLGAVAPNPVGTRARAEFAVREGQAVTAEVLDLLGRRVALVHQGRVPAMTPLALEIDAAALASGAYVLVVRGETFAAAQRMTVAR